MDNHYTICSCLSSEHTLRFVLDKENDELYTEVYLNHSNNLFMRIIAAIKYIFGYTSKYGHFDCTIISKQEAKKLSFFLRNYTK